MKTRKEELIGQIHEVATSLNLNLVIKPSQQSEDGLATLLDALKRREAREKEQCKIGNCKAGEGAHVGYCINNLVADVEAAGMDSAAVVAAASKFVQEVN